MSDKKIETLDDVHTFLEGTVEVEFSITDKKERYQWVQHTLVRFRYLSCCKKEKGLIMRYLGQVSGYSAHGGPGDSLAIVNDQPNPALVVT
ncbi:MAG: hypothetical protein GY934_00530 [Gammaproteobacteria bacterium]|nr:hypothetical protein [Gammaproteobacteria bacterium]MCP4992260.1 hypothetical protein [Gammaproteobacteria bacterium]